MWRLRNLSQLSRLHSASASVVGCLSIVTSNLDCFSSNHRNSTGISCRASPRVLIETNGGKDASTRNLCASGRWNCRCRNRIQGGSSSSLPVLIMFLCLSYVKRGQLWDCFIGLIADVPLSLISVSTSCTSTYSLTNTLHLH